MIEQVRLVELYSAGGADNLPRTVFAFGTHPMATDDEQHAVTSARAEGNKLRIIMDELLRGNNLEEIACRAKVDDDVFDRVPLGATPDDVARCSVAQDVLPARCPGSNPLSLCLCKLDGGCPSGTKPDGTPNIVAMGESVGVKDLDQDGAADDRQFIRGAVGITCNGIDVPIDLISSYWTPSGDQQRPAQGGFDALGPAIVLVPPALPTNLPCSLTFSPEVVDKEGNAVCAPQDGDLANGCSPGDTSAFTFSVEPLRFTAAVDLRGAVSRINSVKIKANAPLDPTSIATITVTEADVAYTKFVATLSMPDEITIQWTEGGLAATTAYKITLPTSVTDAFHQPALQPIEFAFVTGAS